jgi:hypothetical protein
MLFLQLFEVGSLSEIVLLACFLISVLIGAAIFEKASGWSFTLFVGFLAFLGVAHYMGTHNSFSFKELFSSISWKELISNMAVYVALGIATSFLWWVSFVRKVKNRVNDRFQEQKDNGFPKVTSVLEKPKHFAHLGQVILGDRQLLAKVAQLAILEESGQSIYGYEVFEDVHSHLLNFSVAPNDYETIHDYTKRINTLYAKLLPPKAKMIRASLVYSIVIWPVVLLNLIWGRFINDFFNWLVKRLGNTYNHISVMVYGKPIE